MLTTSQEAEIERHGEASPKLLRNIVDSSLASDEPYGKIARTIFDKYNVAIIGCRKLVGAEGGI